MTAQPEPAHPSGVTLTVFGRPKAKGSLRHVGNGRMVEQVEGSKDWRTDVVVAARRAVEATAARFGPFPLDGPVHVDLTFTFAKPGSAPKSREIWPSTRSSGDIDKLARNVCDALVDAGVLVDDARVVDLTVRKVFPGQHMNALPLPGAVIRVRPL